MKSIGKKWLSVVLAAALVFGISAPMATLAEAETYYPSIVIPGVFQCDTRLYDDEGNEMLQSDGTPYKSPFFIDAQEDIVKDALEEALCPVAKLLICQKDKEQKAAKAIADVVGRTIAEKVKSDANGDFVYNVKAVEYNTALSNLSDYDRKYALNAIPLNAYVQKVGLDHLYFYSYVSLDSIHDLAEGLYELIQIAKAETGMDKVNLAPISQGGSLFNALMQVYRDKGLNIADDVNRVVLIVPAADGTAILGDIYTNGVLDDPDALYGYMLPSLMGEEDWTPYLVNLLLRLFPNADLNNILDQTVYTLIEDYLEYSTALWALVPSENYPVLRERFLMDEEDAFIRSETDWYYNAQCNHKQYILDAKAAGVEFFDLVDYNFDFYKICDSWQTMNADGVINVSSTSLGAYCVASGDTLPADYVQANTYCDDPTHDHIDPFRKLDASTGLLPDTTFYFYGQGHEDTARNDVIIRLACRILWDDSFQDVYSEAGYPQFNYARDSRRLINLYNSWVKYDASSLPAELREEFSTAMADAASAIDSTYMPTEDYDAVYARLVAVTDAINGKEPAQPTIADAVLQALTRVLKLCSNLMLKLFDGKGYSDILLRR